MKEFVEKLIARIMLESASCKVYKLINPNKEDIAEFNAYKKCIEIVNQVAEEYNNGWIPCSERLPEVEADVLLSLRSLDVYCGFRANTEGCFYIEGMGYVQNKNIIAWQSLPQPYKVGD